MVNILNPSNPFHWVCLFYTFFWCPLFVSPRVKKCSKIYTPRKALNELKAQSTIFAWLRMVHSKHTVIRRKLFLHVGLVELIWVVFWLWQLTVCIPVALTILTRAELHTCFEPKHHVLKFLWSSENSWKKKIVFFPGNFPRTALRLTSEHSGLNQLLISCASHSLLILDKLTYRFPKLKLFSHDWQRNLLDTGQFKRTKGTVDAISKKIRLGKLKSPTQLNLTACGWHNVFVDF